MFILAYRLSGTKHRQGNQLTCRDLKSLGRRDRIEKSGGQLEGLMIAWMQGIKEKEEFRMTPAFGFRSWG